MKRTQIQPIDTPSVPDEGPAVALDFDGVVTRPHELKREAFAERGYDVASSETSREYCLDVAGLDEREYEHVSQAVNVERLEQVPLREGATSGIDRLVDAGLRPIVVTSRHDDEVQPMVDYIRRHNLPIAGYANTGRGPKVDIVCDLDARAYVDDSYYKLEEFIRCDDHPPKLFFFRHASNGHVTADHPEIAEIGDWESFVEASIACERS